MLGMEAAAPYLQVLEGVSLSLLSNRYRLCRGRRIVDARMEFGIGADVMINHES